MLDYRVPTIVESPPIEVKIVESNDPYGPFGAKEAGEGSLAGFIPALAAAIADATGVRPTELPITPDRLMELMEKQKRPALMEHMPAFTVHRPTTVEDAVRLRSADKRSRYVAGGTDMVVNVRRGIEQPTALIDLGAIAGMHEIVEYADGWRIGASVTLATLGKHVDIARDHPAVSQAARAVAGPTHQSYGTVGGNLCLDTRCLFYNQSEWWRRSNDYCLKRNGTVCHVAPGGKQCFAAFSGDLAPAMLVHDAEMELVAPEGTRRIPLGAALQRRWDEPPRFASRRASRRRPSAADQGQCALGLPESARARLDRLSARGRARCVLA